MSKANLFVRLALRGCQFARISWYVDFDRGQRAAEKQASRDEDARSLASGEKSRADLRRENGALAFPNSEIAWDEIQSLT